MICHWRVILILFIYSGFPEYFVSSTALLSSNHNFYHPKKNNLHHYTLMSLRGRLSSSFSTHKTPTSAMLVKKSVKMHSFACQLSLKQILVFVFFKFVSISIIHPKKNLIKTWKKNWETEFFALNILNEAQFLVCAQIIRKNCE